MTSFFTSPLSSPLLVLLEIWLRGLRDAIGKDYCSGFSADTERSVIRFQNSKMDWAERKVFTEALTPILRRNQELKLERLTPSILDYPPWHTGCECEFKVGNLEAVGKENSVSPEEANRLFRVLWDYGNFVGRQFHRNRRSVVFKDPLEWAVAPWVFLPGVLVSLKPKFGRVYPTLNNGFQGHVREELGLISKLAPDGNRFSIARLTETDRVWILLDYKLQGEEHV